MLSTSLRLGFTQTAASIGIQSTPGKWEMQSPPAEVSITQKPAVLTIDQGLGQLDLDLYSARKALGAKNTIDMLTDIGDQTDQVVLEAIGRIVSEGNQMAAIHNPTNAIADIALQRQDMGPMPIQDYDATSYHPVQIGYHPHETQLSWEVRGTEIHATPHTPIINYTPGKVEMYLAQKNGIQFSVSGQYLNMQY